MNVIFREPGGTVSKNRSTEAFSSSSSLIRLGGAFIDGHVAVIALQIAAVRQI